MKDFLGLRLVLIFSFFVLNYCSKDNLSNLELNSKHVYLILRSDDSKISSKIRNYNFFKDSLYSHIGILLLQKNKKNVYHVHPNSNKDNMILKESLTEFLTLKKHKIEYYSIFLVDGLIKEKVENILDKEVKKGIGFDYDFDYQDSSKLYCSEFVAKVISHCVKDSINFNFLTRKTSFFLRMINKKDSITYLPVDFFFSDLNTRMIYRYSIYD